MSMAALAAAVVYFPLPSRRGSGRCSAAMDISAPDGKLYFLSL
jgi:hypothetical protein